MEIAKISAILSAINIPLLLKNIGKINVSGINKTIFLRIAKNKEILLFPKAKKLF